MSVLKYKDASGNWVEATELYTTGAAGQLKVDIIQPLEDGVSFDLTKYQNCNRFLLYYTGNLNRSLFDSINPNGIQYLVDADAGSITVDRGFQCVQAPSTGENHGAIAEMPSGAKVCYTYENGIFTWTLANAYGEKRIGDNALVIYAE